jgi:hypothetical protein
MDIPTGLYVKTGLISSTPDASLPAPDVTFAELACSKEGDDLRANTATAGAYQVSTPELVVVNRESILYRQRLINPAGDHPGSSTSPFGNPKGFRARRKRQGNRIH